MGIAQKKEAVPFFLLPIFNPKRDKRKVRNMDYKSIYSRHSDYKSEWTKKHGLQIHILKTFGLQIRMDDGMDEDIISVESEKKAKGIANVLAIPLKNQFFSILNSQFSIVNTLLR